MRELQYRYPDEATGSTADGPEHRDSPYQRDRPNGQRPRPARSRDEDGYDADAQLKNPMPQDLGLPAPRNSHPHQVIAGHHFATSPRALGSPLHV